ncbi:hypothetical protein V6N12_048829 [Hibiscus sabdariffa]|uniref:Uncharacterized protein n=1 Tax=Hibiscus sabdariffa TaxID=183260 RepID=A0ABR2EK35_9ROSI
MAEWGFELGGFNCGFWFWWETGMAAWFEVKGVGMLWFSVGVRARVRMEVSRVPGGGDRLGEALGSAHMGVVLAMVIRASRGR